MLLFLALQRNKLEGVSMKKIQKLDYKWVIIAACFVLCFTGLGFVSGNKGLFLKAVSEALQIPRSVYSVSDSLRYVATAITNLFFGVLVAKFGARKLIGVGMGAIALSCLVTSFATDVVGIYIGGALLGIGLTFGGTTMVGYVVNLWCQENRGTIMGVIFCANALGTAVSAPWMNKVIYSGDPFAYQSVYRALAVILLIVGIILVIVFRDKSREVRLPAKKHKRNQINTWTGITFGEALRKPFFYIACVCIFFTGAILQSATGISSAHMQDKGLTAEYVAITSSVGAVALAVFKFLTGFVYDKKGLKFTMLICDFAAIVMLILMMAISDSFGGKIVAMIFRVLAALALPLETIMLPLIAENIFGDIDYGKLLGVFTSVNVCGYAVGPLAANACFDLLGTYQPVFVVYAVIMVLVTVAFLFVHKQARETRQAVEAMEC